MPATWRGTLIRSRAAAAASRVIALDRTTIAALRAHQRRQDADRAAAGPRWRDSGYVFTIRHGPPVAPDYLTRLFRRLVTASGLPPVTLHGLRHGAATLALAAGADLKVVSDQLGHSTIALTADTYTSVLPETARSAAEDTARLLFPARVQRSRAGRSRQGTKMPAAPLQRRRARRNSHRAALTSG